MFTSKIRRTAAALLVVASVAAGATAMTPRADAAIRSTGTGNAQLDNYCQQVAALVSTAMQESNAAAARGDADESTAWYSLAEYMMRRAMNHGCHFQPARRADTTGGKALTPSSSLAKARIKSDPTGDEKLDSFCSDLAGLVNAALANEATERAAGHTQKANDWREYANRQLAIGDSRGCTWSKARRIKTGVKIPQIDTSPQTTGDAGQSHIDTSVQTSVRVGLQMQP
jgi:hypothetical protein